MKRILVIDESDLFRAYMKSRLEVADRVEVITAVNGLDGVSKMRTASPDLIILDYHLTRNNYREVLEEKKRNPNTTKVPVIVTASRIDKAKVMELLPFDVKKVFSKPLKVDAFLKTVGQIVEVGYEVDLTPCILEAHVNDNIIFIEIAQGLNSEKIELLRFRIGELLSLYGIQDPRVLFMMSDLSLSFADAINLERLVKVVVDGSRAKPRHIRFLTTSDFVRAFIDGHKEYSGIEVCSTLQAAIDGLLERKHAEEGPAGSRVLHAQEAQGVAGKAESFQMRFEAEAAKAFAVEKASDAGEGLSIAVVDDDPVIQELVRTTFKPLSASVDAFDDGKLFLDSVSANKEYDLILLDLVMPNLGGFDVLSSLRTMDVETPVIVLSAVSQREAILKAFKAGVKSYLIKPLKPEQLVKKSAEILKANF